MSRPKHLNVPNTSAGIRRINELQELYDKDPEAYEANERADVERQDQERQQQQEDEEAQVQAEYEQQGD